MSSRRPSSVELRGAHAQAVLPPAPVALSAERRRVVPAEAREARRRCPCAGVSVHARRHGAERAESGHQVVGIGVGHVAVEPVEEHDVSLAQLVGARPGTPASRRCLRRQSPSRRRRPRAARRSSRARTRSRRRCGRSGGAPAARTRAHPGSSTRYVQFSDTLIRRTPAAGVERVASERRGGQAVDRPPDQCSRPSTDASTSVISSRARTTLSVGAAHVDPPRRADHRRPSTSVASGAARSAAFAATAAKQRRHHLVDEQRLARQHHRRLAVAVDDHGVLVGDVLDHVGVEDTWPQRRPRASRRCPRGSPRRPGRPAPCRGGAPRARRTGARRRGCPARSRAPIAARGR